jgi:hypothetical protein
MSPTETIAPAGTEIGAKARGADGSGIELGASLKWLSSG